MGFNSSFKGLINAYTDGYILHFFYLIFIIVCEHQLTVTAKL